ncbi:MAG: signal recognition particle-docking protein FtsY [Trichloromonas sp.]|jgi:fused signal recognition particle receptor|nr:signal recognition particle-docking protein FtsY [Trichloromonas sp.]
MDQFSNLLKNYLTHLGELLQLWVQTVAPLLGRLGVPEIYREVGALGVLYLLVTLVVALFILLLLRIGRRKRPVPPRRAQAPPEEKAEAEAVEEAPTAPAEITVEAPAAAPASLFERMRAGLAKTQSALVGRLDSLLSGRRVDDALLDDLEELLITADFGMATTGDVIQALRGRVARGEMSPAALRAALREELRERLKLEAGALDPDQAQPFVIMVVGVNGVGKTTTIGKLARQFTAQGKRVVLGAGDTFRAAAAEQLAIWGERAGVEVIRHGEGADPAAVAFDAAKAAVARKADVLILDTAGRLHTKVNLMEEMKKIRRVLGREIPGAPHETLLVLDATTGQNALIQARLFKEAVEVSGIALTKLDGTAKGGMVVAIGAELGLPVRYVGIGEGVDDLRPFDPDLFVDALFREP